METQRRAVMAFLIAACVVMTALSLAGDAAGDDTKARSRIGVYDNRAVAVAFVRSAGYAERLSALRAAHDHAIRANDTAAAARIERTLDRMQWLAHRQGFGRASVDEAMAIIRDKLPQIAHDAHVSAIVCNPDHLDLQLVERVDVTGDIVRLFNPSAETQKVIDALKTIAPVEVGFDFED